MRSLLQRLAIPVLSLLSLSAVPASAQVTFSIDWKGPTISKPDSGYGSPITEGDVLVAKDLVPELGPLGAPRIVYFAGGGASGGTGNAPGLGLAGAPNCIGHSAGTPCHVEVDALSYGHQNIATPTISSRYVFSVDRLASGQSSPKPPNVWSEAPTLDAAADLFIDLGLGLGPTPPTSALAGGVGAIDGNGMRSGSGYQYPGVGLIEPIGPSQSLPSAGDNLDALAVNQSPLTVLWPVYFSLDAAWTDPLTGIQHSGSAAAHGFRPGDVLVSSGTGTAPTLYAGANQLGLDLLVNQFDDLDALILMENGIAGYQPSVQPNDWLSGTSDMLLFSVRRGSPVLGRPDSIFGLPIEEGDILTVPVTSGSGLSPFPGIYIAAENLGLRTVRSGAVVKAFGDDLNAADLVAAPMIDCNGNGIEDAIDVAFGSSGDVNDNGVPDECERVAETFCFCPENTAPCGNIDPNAGCSNSTGLGALMTASGSHSVSVDDLVLTTTQLPQSSFGLAFMGQGAIITVPFFDGTLCTGGPYYRFPIRNSGSTGTVTEGPGLVAYSHATFPGTGHILAGSSWRYQHWYRDNGGPCGTNVNISSGVRVQFSP
jgi:hypothetical protein